MTMRSSTLGIIILVVIFGGIFTTAALGLWKTKSDRVPARFRDGGAVGEYNPADIRGSYAFGDISELFGIPLDVLGRAFRVPPDVDTAAFKNKDLEALYTDIEGGKEIGTASMRLFVAYYTGLPYTPGGDTYLLRPAVNILKNQAELTTEQIAFLEAHTVEVDSIAGEEHLPQAPDKEQGGEHDESAQFVRGRTTFAELLDWGLPQDTIEAVIEGEMPNPLTLVRDYCTENGLQFSIVKAELQAELDKLSE